jgi:hypothetical protein
MLKNEKGFSVAELILIIVVLVLVGFSGWWVYMNQHKAVVATNTVTTYTTMNTTTSKANTYTGWASYTSSIGGLSFKYPINGWTLIGDPTGIMSTSVTGSELKGTEYSLNLQEDTGHGLSTDGNLFIISVDISSPLYENTKSDPSFYSSLYAKGGISTLSNGLQVWQTTEAAASSGQCNPNTGTAFSLYLVSQGHFYKQLANGQYMDYSAGFCYGQGATTSLTYQEQATSSEITIAKEVLSSLTFN